MPATNTLVQLLALYTNTEGQNAQRNLQTDGWQDYASSRSYTVQQYDWRLTLVKLWNLVANFSRTTRYIRYLYIHNEDHFTLAYRIQVFHRYLSYTYYCAQVSYGMNCSEYNYRNAIYHTCTVTNVWLCGTSLEYNYCNATCHTCTVENSWLCCSLLEYNSI